MMGKKDYELFNIIPGKDTEKAINPETGEERTMVQDIFQIEISLEHIDLLGVSKEDGADFPVKSHIYFVPKRLFVKITKKNLCDWACKQN